MNFQVLHGVGTATIGVSWSDLIIASPDNDEQANAILSSVWLAAGALGRTSGPLLGGALCELMASPAAATTDAFGASCGCAALAALLGAALLAISACIIPAVVAAEEEGARASGGSSSNTREGGAPGHPASPAPVPSAAQRAQTALHAMRKRGHTAASSAIFSALDLSEALHIAAAALAAPDGRAPRIASRSRSSARRRRGAGRSPARRAAGRSGER